MKKHDVYIRHMLDAILKIKEHAPRNKRSFMADEWSQDAIIRNLLVIGEAAKRLPKALRDQNSQIPWKEIIGTRNIVIHEYADTDLTIIWDIVAKGLPDLQKF